MAESDDLCQHCEIDHSEGLRAGEPTCHYCWVILDDLEGEA